MMIGQTLGHYLVHSRLGAGGMGEVWLAEDTTLKRKVALKVLPAGVATDPDRLARFQREAEAVAALSHPNIVTIYSIELDGDIRFLTMEQVEGQSLDQVIPRGGLPLGQVLEIGATLADALAASHEKGIIHRDLKPANIMLAGRERRVKVLDFGLAKLREEAASDGGTTTAALSGEGRILGTVAYMSPEQAEGKPVDARSDSVLARDRALRVGDRRAAVQRRHEHLGALGHLARHAEVGHRPARRPAEGAGAHHPAVFAEGP